MGLWVWGNLSFGDFILPGPVQVLPRLLHHLSQISTWGVILLTVSRAFLGFLMALGVGIPLGLLLGQFSLARKAFQLPLILLQAAPPLLWVIPLILITSMDSTAPLWVAFLIVLPLVTLSIADARRSLKPALFLPFRLYAPGLRWVFGELVLPQLRPALQSILTLGFVISFKSTLVGEWFGSQDGLGRWINSYYYSYEMVDFYGLALLFICLAALFAGFSQFLARGFLREFSPSPPVKPLLNLEGFIQDLAPLNRPEQHLLMNNLGFGYPGRTLFQNFNLEVRAGQVLMITGDSGVGKTTLAHLALGLLRAKEGTISAPAFPAAMFQEDALLPQRDCLGNAALAPLARGLDQPWTRAKEALELVGLGSVSGLFPHELSGGMKKRLTLARALASAPGFVVLDEPFSNLHKEARDELWTLFFKLIPRRGIPALIITHYPDELKDFTMEHLNLSRIFVNPLGDLPPSVIKSSV